MSRIDSLPADRRAVLQLLLRQGKTYDDLASLLRIAPETVRERARDALDRLGPADDAGLSLERQDDVADFLLGQQSASERASTREFLEQSTAGREWARYVAGELRPLAGADLPEIPAEGAEVDEAFGALHARRAARGRQERSSRLGGVLLLAAVGLAIAFFVIFIVTRNDDSSSPSAGSSTTASTTPTTTSTTAAGSPTVLGQINLKGTGKALAAVTLVRQGTEIDLLFQGQGLPPNQKGDVYALWLTGSGAPARLGFMPRVPKSGKLRFPGALPKTTDPSKYREMLMTRETTASPKAPGPVILRGTLPGAA